VAAYSPCARPISLSRARHGACRHFARLCPASFRWQFFLLDGAHILCSSLSAVSSSFLTARAIPGLRPSSTPSLLVPVPLCSALVTVLSACSSRACSRRGLPARQHLFKSSRLAWPLSHPSFQLRSSRSPLSSSIIESSPYCCTCVLAAPSAKEPARLVLPSSCPARLCIACLAFRYSCACCREGPCSVLLRRVVMRAKLLAVDIESVTRALDTVKRCVCLCSSPPDRDLALLLASLLAKSFPSPRHKIRSATTSTNCETPSPCALASATADSAIEFASTPCSIRLAVGDFSTLQIRAARPACAHSSSIGFWRVRV
jgi:hypothetical protein